METKNGSPVAINFLFGAGKRNLLSSEICFTNKLSLILSIILLTNEKKSVSGDHSCLDSIRFFADGDLICMHVLYANFSVLGVGDCGSSWLSMKQYDIGFCMLKLNYCLLGIHKITKVKNDNDLHDPRKWKWNRPPSFFSTRFAKWTKKKKWSPKGINFRFRGVKGRSFSVRSTWLLLHSGIYL